APDAGWGWGSCPHERSDRFLPIIACLRKLNWLACTLPRERPAKDEHGAGGDPGSDYAHAKLLPVAAEHARHCQHGPEQDDGAAEGAEEDDVGILDRDAAWWRIEGKGDAENERQDTANERGHRSRESDQSPIGCGDGEENFGAELGREG